MSGCLSRLWSVIGVPTAIGLSAAYCGLFLARPTAGWPETFRAAKVALVRSALAFVDALCRALGAPEPSPELRGAAYLVLTAALLPWLVLAVAGRGRPYHLGFRRPNRIGWRLVVVGYLLAFPLQLWMVRSPEFAAYYGPHLERVGLLTFSASYVVNMFCEHFFFHGVLLAAFRVGHRWPAPPPVTTDAPVAVARMMRWVGLAQPTEGSRGLRRVARWMGLPSGCVPAICASGVLFAVIHIGKDPRELVLSLPGGIALAYMAYRTNSWLVPFILHVATAGTACAMMVHLA